MRIRPTPASIPRACGSCANSTDAGETPRAWYSASFPTFLTHSTAEIVGHLFLNSHSPPDPEQRDAWTAEVDLLKPLLANRTGHLLLEFNIPRMGLRADAVLLLPGCIVVLEFKVGEKQVPPAARNQVWEYALDTKNFHEPSHPLPIIPVLVPTRWRSTELPPRQFVADGVCPPLQAHPGVAEAAPIVNALDTDWHAYATVLAAHGVVVEQTCPQHMAP